MYAPTHARKYYAQNNRKIIMYKHSYQICSSSP